MPFSIASRFRPLAGAFLLILSAGCQTGAGDDSRPHTWVGTLPRRYTGFDQRTWHDTSANMVAQLLEKLPDRIASASEHRLARNLLISIADAPQGDSDNALLVQRVDALMRLGNVGDAAALARAAPKPSHDQTAVRQEIEAELLSGNVEMACIDLRALAARSSGAWVETGLAACKARAGETAATPAAEADEIGALAAIYGMPLRYPITADPVASPAAYSVAIGMNTKAPATEREEAAFEAARASALDGKAYAKILSSLRVQRGSGGKGPLMSGDQAAFLFQAIGRTADPAQKIALAERGLLSPDGVVDGVGGAMAAQLRSLKPDRAPAPLAGRYARLFYAAGDTATAARWMELAGGPETWPYRAVLKPPAAEERAKWEKQVRLAPSSRERIAAIVSVFGTTTPDDAGADDTEPGQDAVRALDEAAARQRVGETTLRALVILGRGGPTAASTRTLNHVLAALDRVSLHDEAHALAFEAITAVLLAPPPPGAVEAAIPGATRRTKLNPSQSLTDWVARCRLVPIEDSSACSRTAHN